MKLRHTIVNRSYMLSQKQAKQTLGICLILLLLIILIIIGLNARLANNYSTSEPIGKYIIFDDNNINNGDLRVVCLSHDKQIYLNTMSKIGLKPNQTSCKNGFTPLLKQVVGIPGDVIRLESGGVFINDRLIPNSIATQYYHSRYLYPQMLGTRRLKKNEYWLSGNSNNSYDSRYFGAVNIDEIKQKAVILWSYK